MKRIPLSDFSTWGLGILLMALGVALVSFSSFGYSMIAAPVYLLFKKIGMLSFGTVEYLYQGLLLALMCLILRRFAPRYLFSFGTAVIYGLVFDLCLFFTSLLPALLPLRVLAFLLGELCIVCAVVLFVHTTLAPCVYELFVKELSSVYVLPFSRVKLVFDLGLLALSVILSLALFGIGAFADPASLPSALLDGYVLEGIGIGTLIAALVNGPLIGAMDRFLTARIAFGESKSNPR